ncbi:MAG: flagellar M-ring protein FliF [Candidatus Saccharibacteria bacterium]|nr:flagellar M-ring protein FliF [Pseudorhodobacter sp.]
MQNLLELWANLGNRRRAVVIGATLAMFLAILGLARMSGTANMALLYSGLQGTAAGDVITALDAQGVTYEVRGDAVYVDSAQRDNLRMVLAGQGLPASGGTGYELLDSLSGFGTTSQMFDAAYWRAKEGELARTILAMPEIKSARVHIAQAPAQVFKDDSKPTASVTVVTSGGNLSAQQANALRHLVAAAVSGLKPDDVSVVDSVGGLIPSVGDTQVPGATGDARAAEIKANVERLLAARVGPGKAVVEVSVDVVTDREEVNEHTFDPQSRVAISTDTQEKTGTSSGSDSAVTVASNLPTGQGGGGTNNQSSTSDKQERVNYEVSETNRQIIKAPGSIRKLSVAVLVDQEKVTAPDGSVTYQPRTDAELDTLKELVGSAAGIDQTRGDVLTLKSLPFQQQVVEGTLVEASMFAGLDLMSTIQLAVLALVALILGLFVIRPILTSGKVAELQLVAPFQPLALPGGRSSDGMMGTALTGEIDDIGIMPGTADFAEQQAAMTGIETDPVARLRRLIEERQAESVEILRSWMEHDEEPA